MVVLIIAWETESCWKFADVFYALSFIFMVLFKIFFLIFWKICPNLCLETFSDNQNCGLLLGLPKSSATTPFMVAVAVCCWLDLRIIVLLTGADWDIQGEWKHGARGDSSGSWIFFPGGLILFVHFILVSSNSFCFYILPPPPFPHISVFPRGTVTSP